MATEKESLELENVHPHAGVPDGFVDQNGETIVYQYDEDGNYTTFLKLPAKEGK